MRKAMITVAVSEARNQLSGLLDRVEGGEVIIITRRGKPVARLVPDTCLIGDPSQAQAAMQRMRARASQIKPGTFDWDDLKRDRDSGRP
jgi:prevent-host-death family protein